MPYQTSLTVARAVWLKVSSGLVSAIRLQNQSTKHSLFVQATVADVAPTDTLGAIALPPGQMLLSDITLAQLYPGVISTTGYVWVYCDDGSVVSVSHA